MHWLEHKYINLVSPRLRNYKRKSGTLFNFSCPICGDSASNKHKARAYIYDKKGNAVFHCHNCNVTNSFSNFLKIIDQVLYHEFTLEKLREQDPLKTKFKYEVKSELQEFIGKMAAPLFVKTGPLKGLKKVSQLHHDHFCKVYVESRKIPNTYHAKMFFCPKFFAWVNSFIPDKFSEESLLYDEPRLIIPFIKDEKMHAFQGRALTSTEFRYVTIIYDNEVPKIYGLDTVDLKRKTYVFEGPIDSMFIPNSIATAGGDLISSVRDLPKDNLVIIYDNECRSKETREKVDKAIINGYNVCIWPTNLEAKDVNDMILSGMSSDFVRYVIDTHTFKDLRAKLELNTWSKV